MIRRTTSALAVAAAAAVTLACAGAGVAGRPPATPRLGALPPAAIGGAPRPPPVPSGKAMPVTYTNRTRSGQHCEFKHADPGAVQLMQQAATAAAGIPPLARFVVDVADSQIGAVKEVDAPVHVAAGTGFTWMKSLIPGRAYGIYSRCTFDDDPSTIEVAFTYYPPLG